MTDEFSGVASELSRRRAWLEILFLLLFVAISEAVVAVLAAFSAGRLPLPALIGSQGILILGGVSLLLFHAGQRWADVGLHALESRDAGRALLLLAACIAANLLLMLIFFMFAPELAREHMNHLQDIASRLAGELSLTAIAATMFFVGVYEELTARGFLLARCRAAIGGVWMPVLLSAVLFGLGHAYQGWIGVAQTTVIGVIFAASTVRWGTLWPAIFAHALLNTLSVATLAGVNSPS